MEELELVIRNWRIVRGIPSGRLLWFDDKCEAVKLYRIPPHDGEEVSEEMRIVAMEGDAGYLDRVGSVSASEPGQASGDSDRYEQLEILEEDLELPF